MVSLLAVLGILVVPLSAVLVSKAVTVATRKTENTAIVPVLEKTVRAVLTSGAVSTV